MSALHSVSALIQTTLSRIFTGGDTNIIKLWTKTSQGYCYTKSATLKNRPHKLRISQNHKILATACFDHKIVLNRLSKLGVSQGVTLEGHRGLITELKFLDRWQLMTSSQDWSLRVYDLDKGKQVAKASTKS
jgi:hypothetical protein